MLFSRKLFSISLFRSISSSTFPLLPSSLLPLDGPHLRNVGIVAHVDGGKTTLSERLLFYGGAIRRMGDIDHGDTAMDHLPMERERGITIQSASTELHWRGSRFNLIDTPGHVDFTVEVERAVRVLDGCVLVLDGVKGVQAQTVTVWRQLLRYGVPALIFLNKMDMEGANLDASLASIRKLLPSAVPLPVQALPFVSASATAGLPASLLDLVDWRSLAFQGDHGETEAAQPLDAAEEPAVLAHARRWQLRMLEELALHDDPIAECLLEGRPVSPEVVHQALRRLTMARTVVPVFFGSALKNFGVQPLMDGIIRYLPDPFESLHLIDSDPLSIDSHSSNQKNNHNNNNNNQNNNNNNKISKKSNVSSPKQTFNVSDFGRALAFKVVHDHQKGLIVWLRVYDGILKLGAPLHDANTELSSSSSTPPSKDDHPVATQLLKLDCDSTRRVEQIEAGDIGALVGLTTIATGDTLVFPNPSCALKHKQLATAMRDFGRQKRLPGLAVPSPVFTCSVEALRQSDQAKLEQALALYRMEDPSVRVTTNADNGQFQISGMGELHLEIIADRLKNHYKVGASFGAVRISYHATLCKPIARASASWHNPKVGAASLTLKLERKEPMMLIASKEKDGDNDDDDDDEAGPEFVDLLEYKAPQDDGGGLFPNKALRQATLDAIREGVRDTCLGGVVRTYGCPLREMRVSLTELAWEATSTPVAFRACAVKAVADALNGEPEAVMFLQPKMAVAIETPVQYLGVVNSDLAQRHGAVQQMDIDERELATVDALVPLSNLLGYSSHLRSMTRGAASFTMEFAEYGEVTNPQEHERVLLYLRGY